MMVAAAEYAQFTFLGLRSKRIYNVDAYYSDVVNALVNFDSGQGASATSNTFWVAPEPVRLIDAVIVTGGTDTKLFMITRPRQTGSKRFARIRENAGKSCS